MAILEILTKENPRLRIRAKRVARVDDPVRRLMDDMVETMLDAPGVGLAATQVGVPLRVIVMKVDNQLYTLANPEVVRSSGEQIGYEGCLSVPGYIGEVARAEKVVARGLNRNGKQVRIKGEGLLARAIQHEIDHLDGILFIDKLTSLDTLKEVEVGSEEDVASGESVALAV
ncbi:MAG TPA: peptide deformylase [Candidatus Dormibacteraeota bacterium]|nr:peptide deformylase [Candidatus Dormibacteraeota bacterium]